MTQQNYYPIVDGELVGISFNPFNSQQSIMHGTKMLNFSLNKFGTTQDGSNKALATYNQGLGKKDDPNGVLNAIKNYGDDWVKHIHSEGSRYIDGISNIRNNKSHIPGYFGEKR